MGSRDILRCALRIAGLSAVGFGLVSPASADVVEQVSVGLGYTAHDLVATDDNAPEQGALSTFDVEFKSPEFLGLLGGPRPFVGVAVSLNGYTNFLSTGAVWRFGSDRLYGKIGAGGSIHDGNLTLPAPEAGLSEEENQRRRDVRDERTEYGSRTLYHARFAAGMRVSARWSMELGYQHWSNGELESPTNDGLDLLELRLAYKP